MVHDVSSNLTSLWLSELRLRHAYVVVGRVGRGHAVALEAERGPALHYAYEGCCSVAVDGRAFLLGRGDLLLMRRGLERVVSVGEGGAPEQMLRGVSLSAGRVHDFELGAGPEAAVILGAAACTSTPSPRALEATPPVIHIPESMLPTRLRDQLAHLVEEGSNPDPDAPAIVARIAEVVFLLALRVALRDLEPQTPLMRASLEPRLARALHALHSDVSAEWSVTRLARIAGMSRSSFSEEFSRCLHQPPMRYLTVERMRQARALLCEDHSVQEAAQAIGYGSAAAFSTAFKRFYGVPPSRFITNHQSGTG